MASESRIAAAESSIRPNSAMSARPANTNTASEAGAESALVPELASQQAISHQSSRRLVFFADSLAHICQSPCENGAGGAEISHRSEG